MQFEKFEKYYPTESEKIKKDKEECAMQKKRPKIFISHSSHDKDSVTHLVTILEAIGLRNEQLFCSSVPGYNIPLHEDIYDYLKQQFQAYNLHVIFVLSDNYYQSVASMNEMGAAWVLQNKYTTILLPGFEFNEIKGAINPRKIGLKLDGDLTEVKEKLDQLKELLTKEFELAHIPTIRWELKRDAFITTILQSNMSSQIISADALKLLQAACKADDGTIIRTTTLSGTNIQANSQNFITSQERREVAKWEGCLDELLYNDFVQTRGHKGEIFVVTQKGYDWIEEVKK